MTRLFPSLAFAALLVLPTLANVPPPVRMEPTEEVRQTVLAYMENFNAGNVDGIASTFADRDGFTWIEGGQATYASKADAVAGIKSALAKMPGARIETNESFRVVIVDDQTAFAVVPATVHAKDAAGAEAQIGKIVTTLVLVRQGDEWRILTGHSSTAAP